MIRSATRDDLPLIRDILRRSNDTPYDIEAVAEEKVFGRGVSGETRVRVYGDAGVAVSCGKYLRLLGVDRDQRRRGIGTALLRDAAPKIIFAEPGNYFIPGALEPGFFLRRGFCETTSTWTMHVRIHHRGHREHRDASVFSVSSVVHPSLLDFVRKEFGSIWAFEIERARRVVWIEETGFAAIEANNRGLGTFGPTGVAKTRRGRGHGRTLLQAALAELAMLGYERAIIPWTTAVDYYRRSCGAEPAHRFVTLTAC